MPTLSKAGGTAPVLHPCSGVPVHSVIIAALCNVFTPTHNALRLKHASQEKRTQIHERLQGFIVAIVEKHRLDGGNTFTLMKHKHIVTMTSKHTGL